MGWQDRHYNNDSYGGGAGGGGAHMLLGDGVGKRSVTFWLLMINIGVFVIDGLLFRMGAVFAISTPFGGAAMGPLEYWGYFSADTTIMGLQVWRLLTFQFLHGGIGHILGNMIGLFFFGPMVERYWGSKRFLAFYLLCGFSGVVGYLVLWGSGLVVSASWVPLVGASAGIFGILVSAAVIAPNTKVLFMLLFPIPLKVLIWGFIGIAAYTVIALGNQPGSNAGGEAAHLGGALLGYIFMKKAGLLNWADRLSPEAIQAGVNKGRYERKVKQQHASREEVDRILAKVSERGIQSLTGREKKILKQDTERLRGD